MINKLELSTKAGIIRKKLGEDESSPIDIFSLAQSIDSLTLIFYPLGSNISGACFRSGLSSIIALNSDMSMGRQRYTLAHELYHLYFDEEMSSTVCSSKIDSNNENEQCANQFASYFLMPPTALFELVQKLKKESGSEQLSLSDVIRMEQHFGVSHQAMLVRLKEENEISAVEAEAMHTAITMPAARLGFDISLYKPSPENKRILVLGHYIHQAGNLLKAGLISAGKYDELLLDAFRDDIVFGEDTEGGDFID